MTWPLPPSLRPWLRENAALLIVCTLVGLVVGWVVVCYLIAGGI
jgi:hypothetical protein